MIKTSKLQFLPISIFSIVLGLAGYTIASQKIEHIFKFDFQLSNYFLYFTTIIFGLLLLFYFFKTLLHKDQSILETKHPVKLSFFPTISISFLLLSIAFIEVHQNISKILWIVGTVLHFLLTIKIISKWIQDTNFEIKHMNPSWFIPAVGNILIPIGGIIHASKHISWFFFSIGFIFWIILLTIFFNRIIFHKPLPEKLLPTLFLLIAPHSVCFVSYTKLNGSIDNFSTIVYYIAMFFVILLFSQIKMFFKIRFYLSWWAYSFPVSAATIASILMYHHTDNLLLKIIASILYAILSLIIITLLGNTVRAMFRNQICVEEED